MILLCLFFTLRLCFRVKCDKPGKIAGCFVISFAHCFEHVVDLVAQLDGETTLMWLSLPFCTAKALVLLPIVVPQRKVVVSFPAIFLLPTIWQCGFERCASVAVHRFAIR